MNTDCAYVIGSSHQVCQDYARAGEGYAILSDGCSSSPDTDLGARLLVCAAEQTIKAAAGSFEKPLHPWICPVARRARDWADAVGVGPAATDATVWMVLKDDDEEQISVAGWGDGAVAIGKTDGTIEIHSVNYASNAPFYPAYLLDEERLAAWRKSGASVRRMRWDGATDAGLLSLKHDRTNQEAVADEDYLERANTNEFFSWSVPRATTRFVAVFSDGVGSFAERDDMGQTRSVPVSEVVRELTGFKSFRGTFAQRRMNAFLKQCAARGWKHHDDLSMAVIAFLDEEISAN